jgi:hypothetical protein
VKHHFELNTRSGHVWIWWLKYEQQEGRWALTDWSNALYLNRNGSKPKLNANYASNANDNFASPSLRDSLGL